MNSANFFSLLLILSVSCSMAQIKNPKNLDYTWNTDTSKSTVDLSEIAMVVPRNTFPKIDYPKLLSKAKGSEFFYAHEPVIAVAINGQAKAYPLNMLTMHEISNDSLGGVPILPTYCPLCNASVVYDRRLRHENKEYLLTFEVSGMLRHSDMVMADAQTESWWQQLTGEAIVGTLAGAELTVIPSLVVSVSEFFERYPEGHILSPNTGTSSEQRYGKNPYHQYDALDSKPYARYFNPENIDHRLPAMERVVDIQIGEKHKVYPFSIIREKGVINDSFEGQNVVIFYNDKTVSVLDASEIRKSKSVGSVTLFNPQIENRVLEFKAVQEGFMDLQTQSLWDITGFCLSGKMKGKQLQILPHSNHFAFAWLQFYPDSQIYGQ